MTFLLKLSEVWILISKEVGTSFGTFLKAIRSLNFNIKRSREKFWNTLLLVKNNGELSSICKPIVQGVILFTSVKKRNKFYITNLCIFLFQWKRHTRRLLKVIQVILVHVIVMLYFFKKFSLIASTSDVASEKIQGHFMNDFIKRWTGQINRGLIHPNLGFY